MANRKDFELTDEQLDRLIKASKPVPYLIMGGVGPRSPQENVNDVWSVLGKEMGFKFLTVKPVSGKDQHHFTAEVS